MEATILLKLDFSLTAATSSACLAQYLALADDEDVDGQGIEFQRMNAEASLAARLDQAVRLHADVSRQRLASAARA